MRNRETTAIGFTDGYVPVGTHLCLVFSDDEERKEVLLKFLLSGLSTNEKTACFSGNITEEDVIAYLKENGISYDERKSDDMITLADTGSAYFKNDRFDPDQMLKTLKEFYQISLEKGCPACRVIGEMDPRIMDIEGGDRLLEYESRVTQLVRDYPVTSVCQYDAREYDGGTIMDVLKVHPKMLVNGTVVNNPFFIEPEVYLESINE